MTMCELFAMSADRPTDVGHSLSLLMPRGGKIGPHADGWGVAYYEGRAARIFKEPAPASESRCLALLANYDLKSTTVVAHIRKANPAIFGRATANTHPFEREWNGCSWVFAHNGKLPGLKSMNAFRNKRYQPVGNTDSEYAFCLIMNAIARAARPGEARPSPKKLLKTIRPIVDDLAGLGEFNFILSDGENLYVHAHTKLHALRRTIGTNGRKQSVTLLATAPLTAEPWQPLAPNSLRVYADGSDITPVPRPVSIRPTPIVFDVLTAAVA
jgi:predicted glutamine amidotransferase